MFRFITFEFENENIWTLEYNPGPIRKHKLGEAMCLCELAHISREKGNLADAEFYFIKAREIRKEAVGEKSEEVAASWASIGACCFDQGKFREAQTAYEHSVGIRTQVAKAS